MDYKNVLAKIHNAPISTSGTNSIIIPSDKQLYTIDLKTRIINGPTALSVQTDHFAETVYFIVDRFYDSMDLAQANCVIQYVVGDKNYVCPIQFCDIVTFGHGISNAQGEILDSTPKMIIPWTISISATEAAGTIQYFLRFYQINPSSIFNEQGQYDPENAEFSYSLSTLPASAKILQTLPQTDFKAEDEEFHLNVPERYFELIRFINDQTTYWVDV